MSGLLALLTHDGLLGFRLFGYIAYVRFGKYVGAIRCSDTSDYRIEIGHVIGKVYARCACLQDEQPIETQLPEVRCQVSVLIKSMHICATHSSQNSIGLFMNAMCLQEYISP